MVKWIKVKNEQRKDKIEINTRKKSELDKLRVDFFFTLKEYGWYVNYTDVKGNLECEYMYMTLIRDNVIYEEEDTKGVRYAVPYDESVMRDIDNLLLLHMDEDMKLLW